MRGVTFGELLDLIECHISTHTPHARRDTVTAIFAINTGISTHTPHARRDGANHKTLLMSVDFYSHASCEA